MKKSEVRAITVTIEKELQGRFNEDLKKNIVDRNELLYKAICAITHIGNSRENHEDNYLLGRQYMSHEQVKLLESTRKIYTQTEQYIGDFCVAVSDGMGGYEGGEVASFLTVKYLSDNYEKLLNDVKVDKYKIADIINKLNFYVCSEANKNSGFQNMGATLCGVIFIDDKAICFNVGDSRLYRFDGENVSQITVDNTEGQRLLDLGLFTREEFAVFPKRKAIYKYIGKDVELIPDIYELCEIKDGEILLICSDGLSDVIEIDEIQDMLSKKYISTIDKGKFLVEMAVERKIDAGDNITLLLVEK